MSAAHSTIAALEPDVDVDVERRRRVREPIRSAVKTSPGGPDKHVHCVLFMGDDGEGFTSPAADGHVHKVIDLEVQLERGHRHELSAQRCLERHNRDTGRHVQTRR